MLSVGKIMAGPAAAAYYLDQVAQGREDYYAGEGEEAGRWVGAGTRLLEWGGEVDGDDFVSLLGGAGVRKPRANGVAGFDLTFRAPKSVSVLWAIAPSDVVRELRAGHYAAVAEALGYLEREACRGRRGTDGVVQVRGDGFVGAAFVHRSSRAGDPLLHTHVVVGNLTRGPDGRWTALDGRHLYRHQKAAGFLYQAALRRELTQRLGLEWNPVEQGVADVRGVPRAVVEHFSRRRAEILEHMAAHGGRSAASAEIAALETRRAKQDVPFDRLRMDWAARAAEHGLTPDMVDELLGHEYAREPRVPARLPLDLTEQVSTFGRAEVIQALAEAQRNGAHVSELELLATRVLADPEIVALPAAAAKAGVVEARYTTRELLATEAELLDCARQRRHDRVARVAGFVVDRELQAFSTLSVEQREVVRGLCAGGQGVAVVRAAAGTGKTFTLDAAREVWQASGHRVVGCALSARAALELEDSAGIPAVTIAAAKRSLETGHGLPDDGVLVVDEAGMVGTRDLARLAEAADCHNTKLVLVGDDRQLPEIQAGGAFHRLADEVEALELTEVRRQQHAWDRDALDALRNGDVERWARAYRAHGRITVAESAQEARAALVNDWSRAPGEAIMIAARRADVRDLNDRARGLRKLEGRLGGDELEAGGRAFAEGDEVIALRNDRKLGILNGQRGTVRQVDRDHQALTIELDGGRRVKLDSGYLADSHLDHGYAITAHKAQGATVDFSFVLGSQDLYRELGYTALSRHREQARFYVARGDLEPRVERDLPDHDPVIWGLEDLLERSGAKRLAHDSLPHRRPPRGDPAEHHTPRPDPDERDAPRRDPARRHTPQSAVAERHSPKRDPAQRDAPRPDVTDRAAPELEHERDPHKPVESPDPSSVAEPTELGWEHDRRPDDDRTPQLDLDDRDSPQADSRADREAPQPDDTAQPEIELEPGRDEPLKGPKEHDLSTGNELGWEHELDDRHTPQSDHARDSLTDRDTAELEQDRDELRQVFEDQELPWGAEVTRLERERDQAQRDLDATEHRIELLKERRDNIGLFHFGERRELDDRLADAHEVHAQRVERSRRAKHAHDLAESRLDNWYQRFGDRAARLIATQRELNARKQLNEIAVARQQAAKRMPDWADRDLPAPDLGLDLGDDLGLDLGL